MLSFNLKLMFMLMLNFIIHLDVYIMIVRILIKSITNSCSY